MPIFSEALDCRIQLVVWSTLYVACCWLGCGWTGYSDTRLHVLEVVSALCLYWLQA